MAAGKINIKSEEIEAAVKQAEHGHHGEIFPLILQQSDFYPAAHFRGALFLGLIIPMGMYYLPYEFPDPIWYLWAQIPALILGYLLVYKSFFKRLFSTKAEIEEEVYQKAVESFLEFNLHKTKKNSAVLVMISLLEHRVRILADHGFDDIMTADDWGALSKGLTSEIKKGKLNEGLISTIEEIGRIMGKHFPLEEGEENINEIPNSSSESIPEKTTPAD